MLGIYQVYDHNQFIEMKTLKYYQHTYAQNYIEIYNMLMPYGIFVKLCLLNINIEKGSFCGYCVVETGKVGKLLC